MNQLFLPLELSQSIRKLGFSEPCFGYYAKKGSKIYRYNKNPNADASKREGYLCDAPLIYQAILWFDSQRIYLHSNFNGIDKTWNIKSAKNRTEAYISILEAMIETMQKHIKEN